MTQTQFIPCLATVEAIKGLHHVYYFARLFFFHFLLTWPVTSPTACNQFILFYLPFSFSGLVASILTHWFAGLMVWILKTYPNQQGHRLQMMADTRNCCDLSLTPAFDIYSFHLVLVVLGTQQWRPVSSGWIQNIPILYSIPGI